MQINALSEMLILVGLILLALWIVARIFPPRSINSLYGYRTPRSRKDQDSWDHAQKLSNRYMFRLALLFLVIGIGFLPVNITSWSPNSTLVLAISILLFGLGTVIFMVEKSLRRTFPDA